MKRINKRRLYRSTTNRLIGGVCGGLGDYFDIDPTIIRLIWVIALIFSFGTAALIYIGAWIIIPPATID